MINIVPTSFIFCVGFGRHFPFLAFELYNINMIKTNNDRGKYMIEFTTKLWAQCQSTEHPPGHIFLFLTFQFRVSLFVRCRAFGSRFSSFSFSRRELWKLNFDLNVSGITPMKKMFLQENVRGDNLYISVGIKKKKKSEIVTTFKLSWIEESYETGPLSTM